MYAQVGEEEQVIAPPYTRIQLDASMRGRKKRKQGEDNALNEKPPCCGCCMARPLVAYCYVKAFFPPEGEGYLVTLTGGLLLAEGCKVLMARPLVALCYVRVFLPPAVKGSWSPLMAHLPEVACNACLFTSLELACLWSDTYCYDASESPHVCNATAWKTALIHCCPLLTSMYGYIIEGHLLHAAEEVVRAGVVSFVHQVVRA